MLYEELLKSQNKQQKQEYKKDMKEKWSRDESEMRGTAPTISPHYSPAIPLHPPNHPIPPDVTSQQQYSTPRA